MTEAERAYLAGLFDGEGAVFVYRRPATGRERSLRYTARVAVGMTDRTAVARFASAFGGAVHAGNRTKKKIHHRDEYEWRAECAPAYNAIRALLPYIRLKRRVAVATLRLDAIPRMGGGGVPVSKGKLAARERVYRRVWRLNNPTRTLDA